VLDALLGTLSPNPSLVDFVTPLAACTLMCSDQVTRTRLLRQLPTLDDIGIAVRQSGDESQGVQIPRTDVASSQGGVSTSPDSSKGKSKVAPRIVFSDTEVSSEEDEVPLQRRMRPFHDGGSTVSRPLLLGYQALGAATAPWPDPRVVGLTTPDRSNGDA
jgi:hypothetical protein